MSLKELEIFGIIAFDGVIRNGLRLHPDGEHLVYPMGNKITIKHVKTGEQFFLTGHKNFVSALCISSSGDLIASGQINHHGFKAMVIIWDYRNRKMKSSYEMHKVRVEDVCFTENGQYLISLGGRDDGRIIIWDIENGTPLCGTSAGNETCGNIIIIARANICKTSFITGGDRNLKLWRINSKDQKLYGTDIKVGKIKRSINCAVIDENDENVYCGTTSGDIIKARLNIEESEEGTKYPVMIGCYSKIPTNKRARMRNANGLHIEVYPGGVKNLLLLKKDKLIVGTGDGTVELIEIRKDLKLNANKTNKSLTIPAIVAYRTTNVCAMVTSMIRYQNNLVIVGTALCEIYEIELSSFQMRLIVTCHTSSIYDLAFPSNSSEIFATASKNDIRIWKLATQKELLRITVSNLTCSSICFNSNGDSIISAWNDGTIRGFALNGGKLLFEINCAHTKSVSTITITKDDDKLISGGCDGQVRIWNAKSELRHLLQVLKEHRGPITSLHVSPDNKSLISSSTDGTCILWDLRNFTRKFMLSGSTMYMATCFVPTGVQILTCGTDRKIAYWETLDGSLVREIEGSMAGTLNTISISYDGQYFLTGSEDSIVKLWEYRTASTIRLGLAHAAAVTRCVFAPDNKFIVTASADGAIMLWEYPFSETLITPIKDDTKQHTLEPTSVSCSSKMDDVCEPNCK
ncbi:cilia- and flagella-associated protein 52 isoform X3 [Bombus pyrosoma]|uniref:cilia- and flagella-associated protein 52 isoform X3 n=1 Tax=Bombus pyrosoma TaxID=396416 RepID=UPI001CB9229C|nr:cilia- and flagella-associated protein 52 isoform X3 [Bombus pyrosoma]XP_043599668.1 cilia- and flagella-associated protein 52 isoform X3 [Bombus pyrosoma]